MTDMSVNRLLNDKDISCFTREAENGYEKYITFARNQYEKDKQLLQAFREQE